MTSFSDKLDEVLDCLRPRSASWLREVQSKEQLDQHEVKEQIIKLVLDEVIGKGEPEIGYGATELKRHTGLTVAKKRNQLRAQQRKVLTGEKERS